MQLGQYFLFEVTKNWEKIFPSGHTAEDVPLTMDILLSYVAHLIFLNVFYLGTTLFTFDPPVANLINILRS